MNELHQVADNLEAMVPALLFLCAGVPLAALLDGLGFFDALAGAVEQRFAEIPVVALWVLAALTTVVLNLDTTVVLLTPLYIRLARRAGVDPFPLALVPLLLAAFVSLLIAANVGSILTSKLVNEQPGLFIALSARNRNLFLTVPSDLGFPLWATIASLRLALSAVVCHYLGRAYGDRALRWFWRFLGMPQEQVSKFETGFAKAEWAIVPFFIGSNIVWVLSGAARTGWRRLAPLFAIGLVGRLALLWWLGRTFRDEVKSVLDLLNRYQLPLIVITLVVVVAVNVRNFRKGA